MSFTSAHNDHLDPDKHLHQDEEPETPQLTPQQKAQVAKLRNEIYRLKTRLFAQPRTPITKESLFEGCPEGDFEWDSEAEDVGNAWNCGESDCETGWHESIQVIERGRKDGKTWFVVLEDSDSGSGDYQPCAGWDEREGDEVAQSILDDLWFHLYGRSIEHFAGWAEYCIDAAITGNDPLDNWVFGNSCEPNSAIEAARDNVKYLRKMKRLQTKHLKPKKLRPNEHSSILPSSPHQRRAI